MSLQCSYCTELYALSMCKGLTAYSDDRYQERKVLSALDGVPYAVKDMCDALPYQTTCGTTYMPTL